MVFVNDIAIIHCNRRNPKRKGEMFLFLPLLRSEVEVRGNGKKQVRVET